MGKKQNNQISKNGYYPIVCISGSMRFFDKMLEIANTLTLNDSIVLMPYSIKASINPTQQKRLDTLHLRKIAISDSLYVVNVNGYIGESTSKEIAYAEKHNIPVTYLEKPVYPNIKLENIPT